MTMVVRSSNHHGDRRFQLRIFTHQSKAREVKSDAPEMVSRMRSWRQEQLWKKVPGTPESRLWECGS